MITEQRTKIFPLGKITLIKKLKKKKRVLTGLNHPLIFQQRADFSEKYYFPGTLSNHFEIIYVLCYLNILARSFFENAQAEMDVQPRIHLIQMVSRR